MELMLLQPIGKDYLWGGERLKSEYGKTMDLYPLAETWECSDHPDGPSMVKNGVFAGKTLQEVLKKYPEFLGKKANGAAVLPILVKLIDAEKNLSVQVHPDDEFAWKHEGQRGKTEMWYVLDAKPGAYLYYGFAHEVTKRQLQEGIETGKLAKHLQKVEVKKGDVFFIPSGTVHAICAGILLAEVQESSNVTYRVYDYDRKDFSGKKRELHFDKAFRVMNKMPNPEVRQKQRLIHFYPGYASELICRCKYFEVERILVSRKTEFEVGNNSFQVLLCLEGKCEIIAGKSKGLDLKKGDCVFCPANIGKVRLAGQTELLKIRC